MKYAIVFSSHSGNTARLAESLKESMPQANCVYFGAPDKQALSASVIFVGFWTDKGNCDKTTKKFLKMLNGQHLFLFGTAGFGGDPTYFKKILDTVKVDIDTSVHVVGSFMCQGEMPVSVLERYQKMLADGTDCIRVQEMIDNFNNATSHPNQADLESLKYAVDKIIEELK